MKSSFKLVAMVMAVAVLCVGVPALATDFTWDANSALTSWLTPAHWDQDSGDPDDSTDNATIDAAANLCTFDPGSALTINNLTLGGTSPTKRKLHIEDGALTVNRDLTLTEYAELDVDDDLTVIGDISLSGQIWIDLTSTSLDARDIVVDGASTRLDLTTGELARFEGTTFTVDADAAGVARLFKITGGGKIDLGNAGILTVRSDADVDNRRAKLWFADGSISIGNAATVLIAGGSTLARRVEFDFDEGGIGVGASSTQLTTMSGYVIFDLAQDIGIGFGRLVIGGPVRSTVVVVAASGASLSTASE